MEILTSSSIIRNKIKLSLIYFILLALFSFITYSAPTCNGGVCVENFTSNSSWNSPLGVDYATIEAWGGGGTGGGGGANKEGGGGGAGGQYAKKNVSLTIGASYSIVVAQPKTGVNSINGLTGDDTTFNGTLVIAKGGVGGLSFTNGGTGGVGSASGGVGDTVYAGGNGAAQSGLAAAGGGGSGAGTTGTGNSASTTTGGVTKSNYGGAGGDGSTSNNAAGNPGNNYGGGGGGSTANSLSGDGGIGHLMITYDEYIDTVYSAFSSLVASPVNNSVYSSGQSYQFTVDVTNTNGTVKLEFDGTNYTASNIGGDSYRVTISSLSAGNYNYKWYSFANGLYNNLNNTPSQSYILQKASLSASLTNNKAWTRDYDGTANSLSYSESNSGDGDVTYRLYQDGILRSTPHLISSGGIYNIILNSTGGENYSASSNLDSNTLTINGGPLSGSISGTSPINYGVATDIAVSESNSGDGDVTYGLYRNNVYIGLFDTSVLSVGTYNYIYNATSGENFSANPSLDTFSLTVNKATPSGLISGTKYIILGNPANIQGTESNSGDGDVTYKLYRDGVEVSNPDNTVLGSGIYNYIYNTTGGTNYSASSSLDTFNLNILDQFPPYAKVKVRNVKLSFGLNSRLRILYI